jgi:hypothetical protein
MTRRHRRSGKSERLREEVEAWSRRIGTQPQAVYVQSMRSKWASCSPAGRLYFSSDLPDQPARFRNVVIVHELLHLRIQNHGKLFKSLLNAYVPEWEQAIRGRASRICR